MAPEIVDVAIVGYGPVGQLLAILLGQRGWRVRVLERWPEPYPLPRAVHFDHEVARILQAAGVIDALRPRTEPASIYEWRNAAGECCSGSGATRSAASRVGPNRRCSASRSSSESSTSACARCRPCRSSAAARWSACATPGITWSWTRGAATTTRDRFARASPSAATVRNSFVRGVVDPSWHDLGFAFDWLVVDVIPREARAWDPINWQLCDPARPTTLVSGGPGRRRWEFMRLPHETLDELNSEATAWRLLEPWEHPAGQRAARAPRGLHLPRRAGPTPGARAGSCWPATRRT